MELIKKIWLDPVGSKVIAGIILAALGTLGAAAYGLINNIPFSNIFQSLGSTINLPLWVVIFSPLLLILLSLFLHRQKIWPFSLKLASEPRNVDGKVDETAITKLHATIAPTYEEQAKIIQTLKESDNQTPEKTVNLFDDPHEYRFSSIEKIRQMEGREQQTHLNRFLGGLWEVTIRKGKIGQTYNYQISTLNNEVLLRRQPGKKQVYNIQIRQIEFDAKRLIVKWVLYSEAQKIIVERETLDIKNDEMLSGMSSGGFIVTYVRKNLFKAL